MAARGVSSSAAQDVLWFTIPPIVVEVELDYLGQATFVLLSEAVNGKPPHGYYLDERGNRVRWHLAELLDAIGASSDAIALRDATRGSGGPAMERQIRLALGFTAAHRATLSAEVLRRTGLDED